jgi:ribosome biogenesis GTPase
MRAHSIGSRERQQVMSLDALGWNERFDNAFAPYVEEGLEPARVARQDRDRYLVLGRAGEHRAEVSGALRHRARGAADLPAVGDWVATRGSTDPLVIEAVLPRAGAFTRKIAGRTTDEQVIAANVDSAFIVAGLDGDLNARRIERYLTAAWEGGAEPVVVLNKADLADDLEAALSEVESVAMGIPVLGVSALRAEGLDRLSPWLSPGKTVAFLGSSGVGKSTLVNALLGEERQSTGDVRSHDSRGRHTTTRRELIQLPGGALLLDTPGMRQLQLWGGEESLDGAFPDIVALAAACRFRDCRHRSEPGCAVLEAVERGELEAARFESWKKLQRELRWLTTKQDARARAEETARWKAISKTMKHHPKSRRP